MPDHTTEPGALQTPHAFRRATGAHAIILWLLGADLLETVLLVLIGAFAGPLLQWFIHATASWMHTSLIGDIVLVLSAALLASAILGKVFLKWNDADSWGCLGLGLLPLLSVFALLWLVKPGWIALHASVFPLQQMEPFPWPLPFVASGAWIAFALSFLAHLLVWVRVKRAATTRQHTFSRAHQDGDAWVLVESAYAIFRKDLARFDPAPMTHLKTPPTFLYYTSDAAENQERTLYWSGPDLILPVHLISAEPEQAEILLSFLARLLYDYQSPEMRLVEQLFPAATLAHSYLFTRFLLGFAILAAQPCAHQWDELDKERVLDRDRFAYWLGQGPRLRKQLERRLTQVQTQGLEDHAIPTLTERIDHLKSLSRKETRQVKQLREALPHQVAPPPSA